MLKNKFTYPVILFLVITGFYFSAVNFPYIGYDNNLFIIENPLLGNWDWNNFIEIWRIGGVKLENLYIPLTYVTYYFETALFGKTPSVMHFDNIVLHCANCILLFYLAGRIGLKPFISFITALAFAIHPLQVEPVVWCMGRKDLLSTLFALLCIHSYLSFASKKQLKWVILTVIFGIFSMLSKPVMVILPGILLIIEFFLLHSPEEDNTLSPIFYCRNFLVSCINKWKFTNEENSWVNGFVIRKISIIMLSGFSLLAVYFNLSGPFRAPSTRTPIENILCLVYLLTGWFKRFIMVDSLEHFYRPPTQTLLHSKPTEGFIILFIATIVILYLIFSYKYGKKIIFGFSFFLIAFLPPLAHLKYTQEFITADRYGYFPLIGIFIAIAVFYEKSSGIKKKIASAALSIWFIFIIVNNISAVNSWSSNINFWKLEVKTKPESSVDNYFLGASYQKAGDYRNALKHFEVCIKNENKYTQKALISSGSIFFYIKQFKEAENFYKKALASKSEHNALIYYNLGETYRMQRKVDSAMEAYKKCLELDNSQVEANLRIAQIYLFRNNKKLAGKYAENARKLGIELTDDLKKALGEEKP